MSGATSAFLAQLLAYMLDPLLWGIAIVMARWLRQRPFEFRFYTTSSVVIALVVLGELLFASSGISLGLGFPSIIAPLIIAFITCSFFKPKEAIAQDENKSTVDD